MEDLLRFSRVVPCGTPTPGRGLAFFFGIMPLRLVLRIKDGKKDR